MITAEQVEAWFPALSPPTYNDPVAKWVCACGVEAAPLGQSRPGNAVLGPDRRGMDGYQRHMEWHAERINEAATE